MLVSLRWSDDEPACEPWIRPSAYSDPPSAYPPVGETELEGSEGSEGRYGSRRGIASVMWPA